jgi:hypothetical protein
MRSKRVLICLMLICLAIMQACALAQDLPGKDLESNWLPSPDGPFYLVIRLYGPETKALEGKWTPPKVKKADARPETAPTQSISAGIPSA